MFGIGRRSTQTTLASAESVSIRNFRSLRIRTGTDKYINSNIQHHDARPPQVFLPLDPRKEAGNPLSISSPTAAIEPLLDPSHKDDPQKTKSDNDIEGLSDDKNKNPSMKYGETRNRRYHLVRSGWFRGLKGKLKSRLCSKVRDLAIRGHGLRVQFTPLSHGEGGTISDLPPMQEFRSPKNAPPLTSPDIGAVSQTRMSISDANSPADDSGDTGRSPEPIAGHTFQQRTEGVSIRQIPNQVAGPGTENLGRLGIIRREKTLRRQALDHRRCTCPEDCTCKVDPGPSSRPNRHIGSLDSLRDLSVLALPGHPLESLLVGADSSSDVPDSIGSTRNHYADHVGSHIAGGRRASEAYQSNSTGSDGQSRERFSQATTANSNGSSISLEPRSSSLSALLPDIPSSRRRRRHIQTAMRNVESLNHGHVPVEELDDTDPPGLENEQSSTEDSESRPSTAADSDPRTLSASAASFTNPENISDRTRNYRLSTEEWATPRDEGSNSHGSLHGSQQATPTLSPTQPETGSTLLSSQPSQFALDVPPSTAVQGSAPRESPDEDGRQ